MPVKWNAGGYKGAVAEDGCKGSDGALGSSKAKRFPSSGFFFRLSEGGLVGSIWHCPLHGQTHVDQVVATAQVNLFLLRMCKILVVTKKICDYLLPKEIQVCNKVAIYTIGMRPSSQRRKRWKRLQGLGPLSSIFGEWNTQCRNVPKMTSERSRIPCLSAAAAEGTGKKQQEGRAMATLDRKVPSPEAFLGKPWSSWIDAAKLHCSDNVDLEEAGKEGGKSREVMRLNKEDMHLFGHYPAHDDFYLVVCSACNQVVKPQVFQSHCGRKQDKRNEGIFRNGPEDIQAIEKKQM
ncbi:hypothetical protein MJT46_005909 [Ovis ammon polii x Ovis aries]|nr:hypothetical protein MJT46_005909 [Ovis ammon polii x Ovis aries]